MLFRSVIAVSHDRYFLDRFARRIFAVEAGGVLRQYPGGYSDYERSRQLEAMEQEEMKGSGEALQKTLQNKKKPAEKNRTAGSGVSAIQEHAEADETGKEETGNKSSGLTFSEKVELEKLEETIAGKEAESKMIAREISLAGNAYEKIAKLSEQLGVIEKELETLTERWLELSDKEG